MNLLKKAMCGAGLAVVMLMCSCANGEEMSGNITESAGEAYMGEKMSDSITESAAEAYMGEAMSDSITEITAETYTSEAEYAELVLTEAEDNGNGDISYRDVTQKIENYYGRYIFLNIEENEIAREEIEATQQSSEGGIFEIFRTPDNEPVRYRQTLCFAMGQDEENYYIIGENEVYFTRLEKYYDTYHLEKAGILNYVFSEYWIEGGEVYYLDRVNEQLVICSEDPVPEQFHEISEQLR